MRKQLRKRTWIFLWIAFFLPGSLLYSADPLVDLFNQRFSNVEGEYEAQRKKLYSQYAQAILRASDSFREAGDLNNLLAAQKEAKLALESLKTGEVAVQGTERIRAILNNQVEALQTRRESEIFDLRKVYLEKLNERVSELTKLGLVDQAVSLSAVVKEQEKFLTTVGDSTQYSIEGKLHVHVDDKAIFFVNGEKKRVAGIGVSVSDTITLSEGDSLVIQLQEHGGGKVFMFAFEVPETERVVFFRASDFREIEDSEKLKLTEEEFNELSKRPDKIRNKPDRLNVRSKSDHIWGSQNRMSMGLILTRDILDRS